MSAFVADVVELAELFRRQADAIAHEEGSTQTRWYALSVFSGDPLTVSQGARRLGTSRQALQRTADELVSKGLARTEPNPDHRTSPYVRLTDEGSAVLARITRRAARSRKQWLPDVDLGELAAAHDMVRAVRDALRDVT